MLEIPLEGPAETVSGLIALGNQVQRAFHFVEVSPSASPLLRIVEHERAALFTATRAGVVITSWRAEGLLRYLGIPVPAYLLVVTMLGLVQWRALISNEALEPEDFAHENPHDCLFVRQLLIEEYALRFENPYVCASCFAFYGFLIPQAELGALRDALDCVRGAAAACA